MTLDSVCARHETPNRKLVLHSMLLGDDVFQCDECEAEILERVWNRAMDEMLAITRKDSA